ncbi:MAG: hypothetical protein NTZ05_18320, partial [Chloroflexi bacterium]|nr:hypothetical protein [Chloroflexota bacterium]
ARQPVGEGRADRFSIPDRTSPAASPPAAAATPAGSQGAGVAFATPPKPLTLPADAAPHQNALEWWYYTGHLEAEGGKRYGFEFVMFQAAGKDPGKAGYVSHAAITDLQTRTFKYAEKLTIAPIPGDKDSFSLKVDDWSMAGKNGDDQLRFTLDGYALELKLKATKPPVLHGGTGYIAVGEKEFSYYYSRPRMAAEGTLTAGGQTLKVTGDAWFDQQWGDMKLQSGGWDWFGVQFDDKTELMVSNLRDASGKRVALYGTYVSTDGVGHHLSAQDITLMNGGLWISPHTGARYPMGWGIQIPRAGLDVILQPELQDSELDTSKSTGAVYWEGKASVQGTGFDGSPLKGNAFVELTGYAKGGLPGGAAAGR